MLMERKKKKMSEMLPTTTINNSLVFARSITEPFNYITNDYSHNCFAMVELASTSKVSS